jgi:DNA polymerase-3 subunit epsilon
MRKLDFLAIDFETANYDPTSACAVGLCIVRGGKIVESRKHLIQPPDQSFHFRYLHGIGPQQVAGHPGFKEVWMKEVLPEFKRAGFIAAHNASFDRRVLEACCERFGAEAPLKPFVCTVKIARYRLGIFPSTLDNVAETLGIALCHHDPASDAEACAHIVLHAAREGWVPTRAGV